MPVSVVMKKSDGGEVVHSPVVAKYLAAMKLLEGWTEAEINDALITYQNIDAQLQETIWLEYRKVLDRFKGEERETIRKRIEAAAPMIRERWKVSGFGEAREGGPSPMTVLALAGLAAWIFTR